MQLFDQPNELAVNFDLAPIYNLLYKVPNNISPPPQSKLSIIWKIRIYQNVANFIMGLYSKAQFSVFPLMTSWAI